MTPRSRHDLVRTAVPTDTPDLALRGVCLLILLLPAAAAAPATIEVTPDRITIDNGLIGRTLSIKDGVCGTVRFENRPAKTHLDVNDQGPHLRLINGKEVPASSLRISGKIVTTPPDGKGAQVTVTIPVACTQPAVVKARVHLSVADGEHFTRKWCDVESAVPVDTVQVEQLTGKFKPALGGRGHPLFIDDRWFAGLEYPAGYHEAAPGQLRLYHFPGRTNFTTKRAVWGADVEGNLADSFEAYLARIRVKPRSFLQYNTWYDLRGTELAAETVVQRFEEFRKAFLGPYGLRFDAVVPDDGWQNPQSIWDVNRKMLPQGYKPLADALAKHGNRVGLWMPLNGTKLDIAWGAKQGYEKSNHGDYYCLASQRYGAAVRKATELRIRDANLSYYKHDFNWFRCSAKGHLHLPTPRHGFEANVDALIDLLAYERKLQPDIFLNVTSGMWLSPWWLMHADTIWMGADDFGYDKHYPQLSPREWEMSYRDHHLYRRCRVEKRQVPVSALMTHGIIHGRRNRLGGPDETLREWSDYVVLYYGRGVMLKELYLTPSLLNAEWWDALGRATRWAVHNAPTLVHTRIVGAEPRTGGVYGYVHWSERKGILVLRNPAPGEQTFELTLAQRPKRFGSPTPAWDVEVVYPYQELLAERLMAAQPVKLGVPGRSVAVWEVAPAASGDPRPRGVRRLDAGRTCRTGHPAVQVRVTAGTIGAPATQPAATKPAATRPAGKPPELALSFELPAQPLSRADVLLVSRGASVLPIGAPSLNGKPAKVRKVQGADWHLLQCDCSGMTGSVKVTAPIQQVSVPFVFSPPTLEAWLLADLPLAVATPPTRPTSSQAATQKTTTTTTTTTSSPASKPSTAPTSTQAAKQPPATQPALPADRPVPRPYRPELGRRSYCLLASTPLGPPWSPVAAIKPDELAKIKAAKLRVELFDVNGGAYADKHILLNGQPLCRIPPNDGAPAKWQERIIDLPADWLKRIKPTNTVRLTNKPRDLFKFRGIALAVQTADGRWITSSLADKTHATSQNWRYAEGQIFDGDQSPDIAVAFGPAK